MSNVVSVTEDCGMQVHFSITSLIFSQDDMELYFEGSSSEGSVVLMIGNVKLKAKYYFTPEGYEVADSATGKTYWLLDCLEAFKQFARSVLDTQMFSD